MASLTEVSIISRRFIRYGIYFVILMIVGRIAFGIGRTVYLRMFPPPPPPPTVGFGKLPFLPFPSNVMEEEISYTLETPEGSLPTFADQGQVFFMPPFSSSIRDEDVAKDKATKLEFNPNGKPLHEGVPNIYFFTKTGFPVTLTMNIINGRFSIYYDIAADPTATSGTPPTPEMATDKVTRLLTQTGLLAEDLTGRITHQFLKVESGKYVSAISLSEANLIKVNIFRKNYGEADLMSVTPNPSEANVWFLLSGGAPGRDIILAEYSYFPIDVEKMETYPLKTAEQAWEELKQGKGKIVSYGNKDERSVTVRRVYLAYYDAGQYTEFYQPIVVFEGDNDFVAYIPAVTDEFYGENPLGE